MSILLSNLWHKVLLKGGQVNMLRICYLSSNVSEISYSKSNNSVMINLKNSTSIADLKLTVQKHLYVMTPNHMVAALYQLYHISYTNKNILQSDIIQDPTFDALCHQLQKHVNTIEVADVVKAIKVFSKIRVPEDSPILQSLLQIIRTNISQMNLEQVMTVDWDISAYDGKTNLVDALKLALPLAFQVRLQLELSSQNLYKLEALLKYCCYNNLPNRCLNNVVTSILLHDQKNVTPSMARNLVKALCKSNTKDSKFSTRIKLLHACCDIIAVNLDKLSRKDISQTLAHLKTRILNDHPQYYHAEIFDAAANNAIQNNWDFCDCILLVEYYHGIYVHTGLSKYMCDKAASSSTLLSEASISDLFVFINCLANFNYIPELEQWKCIRSYIIANPVFDTIKPNIESILLCLIMASVNLYYDKMIQNVFSENFLNEYLNIVQQQSKIAIKYYWRLILLQEAVQTFHSDKYKLPQNIAERVHRFIDNAEVIASQQFYEWDGMAELLTRYLARIAGMEYVAKNIELSKSIHCDAFLCLEEGRLRKFEKNAAPLNSPMINVTELNLPPGSEGICIKSYHRTCYSMNSGQLRGIYRLQNDLLEARGYVVVSVNRQDWSEVPEHNKTTRLIEMIKNKCAELGLSVSEFDRALQTIY